ncbi:MAG TPA: ABC transporter ATP-binding protein [Candidatus Thermoplasmatota archaeon]|nr:ABC transporter ATP-binding protein [Candidatus Thermoplasmatota archaeon]
MADVVVESRGLSKLYGGRRAVDALDLRVTRGEIFGLFGPNGAGKSTTLRLLTALTEPSEGTAVVCGLDVRQARDRVRSRVAILPENPTPDGHLKPDAYLGFCAALRGESAGRARAACRETLASLGVPPREKPLSHLSMGQRQKVEIARILLDPSPLLVLDEPFNALDLDTRRVVMARLREMVRDGRTIVYTSHHLLEAERFVDRFGFLRAGRLAAVGAAGDLKRKFLAARFRLEVTRPQDAVARLRSVAGVREARMDHHEIEVLVDERSRVGSIVRALVEAGHEVTAVVPQGSIEDLFDQLRQETTPAVAA